MAECRQFPEVAPRVQVRVPKMWDPGIFSQNAKKILVKISPDISYAILDPGHFFIFINCSAGDRLPAQ